MDDRPPTVRVYYVPESFPCGAGSACCGPVGQSAEDVSRYVEAIKTAVPDCSPELIDASGKLNMGRDLPAIKLLSSFGAAATPIFMVGSEVVSMGPPILPELIQLVAARLARSHDEAAGRASR